jgi:alpha-1,3-glucosyltransferase
MRAFWHACAALEKRASGTAVPVTLFLALLLRAYVGLHPHSGEATPPKFGDYEAQRHWMARAPQRLRVCAWQPDATPQEITLHTPVAEWYVQTQSNDLAYWGLDYPPLSAYQSWLCGVTIAAVEPDALALGASRGYETPSSKRLMRASVLAFDALCLFPAVLAALRALHPQRCGADVAWALAAVVLQPGTLRSRLRHMQLLTPLAPQRWC